MPPRDFSQRVMLPELMDDPSCDPASFRDGLADLARVNRLTLAYAPTLRFLHRVLKQRADTAAPLRILDVGGGYGDMLRAIDHWAVRRGVALEMTSVDLSPQARVAGQQAPGTFNPLRWVTADIFAHVPDAPVDLVLSSLFTHHLTEPQLVRFLGWMEDHARLGWFVNDLHRHKLPFHVFRVWSRAAGWHRFVQHDGPVSIARAFTKADWRRLLAMAALPPDAVQISWHMPFRLCVSRIRAAARAAA